MAHSEPEVTNENIRKAIDVLYRHVQLREQLVGLTQDKDVVPALLLLAKVPTLVVDRLADSNSG